MNFLYFLRQVVVVAEEVVVPAYQRMRSDVYCILHFNRCPETNSDLMTFDLYPTKETTIAASSGTFSMLKRPFASEVDPMVVPIITVAPGKGFPSCSTMVL
jgi:hypothetical protein